MTGLAQKAKIDAAYNASMAGHNEFGGLNQVSDPLSNWYGNNNDDPWVMPSTVSSASTSHLINYTRPFSGYRDQAAPSESGTIINATLPSDSGYLSYHQHSIAESSLCGDGIDRTTETASITGGFVDLSFGFFTGPLPPGPVQFGQPVWHQSAENGLSFVHNDDAKVQELWCSVCRKMLKTKSDKKKHVKRHTKPHICEIDGCKRTEGFGTANDLDRHVRSCHPEQSKAHFIYLCPVDKCTQKSKEWPRADNFRAHIKRVHKAIQLNDDQLEQCRHQSRNSPRASSVFLGLATNQDNQHTASTCGNHVEHAYSWPTLYDTDILNAKEEADISERAVQRSFEERDCMVDSVQCYDAESVSAQHESLVTSTEIHGAKSPSICDAGSTNDREIASLADLTQGGPSQRMEESCHTNQAHKQEQNSITEDHHNSHEILLKGVTPYGTSEVVHMVDSCLEIEDEDGINLGDSPPDLGIDVSDPAVVDRLLETLHKQGILEKHGYKKEAASLPSDDEGHAENLVTNPAGSKGSWGCPSCHKTFARRCELRKHEKRHIKPFGCTFAHCSKSFGSKNDWKRHENSQHQIREMWKCDERHPSAPTRLCGKPCRSAEDFRQHLSLAHGLVTTTQVDLKVERSHVGRNYDERFWCGFCNKIIETKSKEQGAWMERFDHIGEHYASSKGRPRRLAKDWNDVEADTSAPTDICSTRMPEGPGSYTCTALSSA